MSDTNDVVEVLPCTPQFVPTEKELKIYKVIKVKGMTKEQAEYLKRPVTEEINGKTRIKKYRQCQIDWLNLPEKEYYSLEDLDEYTTLKGKTYDKKNNAPIDFNNIDK